MSCRQRDARRAAAIAAVGLVVLIGPAAGCAGRTGPVADQGDARVAADGEALSCAEAAVGRFGFMVSQRAPQHRGFSAQYPQIGAAQLEAGERRTVDYVRVVLRERKGRDTWPLVSVSAWTLELVGQAPRDAQGNPQSGYGLQRNTSARAKEAAHAIEVQCSMPPGER